MRLAHSIESRFDMIPSAFEFAPELDPDLIGPQLNVIRSAAAVYYSAS